MFVKITSSSLKLGHVILPWSRIVSVIPHDHTTCGNLQKILLLDNAHFCSTVIIFTTVKGSIRMHLSESTREYLVYSSMFVMLKSVRTEQNSVMLRGILMLALFVYNASSTAKKEIKKFMELNVEKGSWDTMEISTKLSQAATHKMQVLFAKRKQLWNYVLKWLPNSGSKFGEFFVLMILKVLVL